MCKYHSFGVISKMYHHQSEIHFWINLFWLPLVIETPLYFALWFMWWFTTKSDRFPQGKFVHLVRKLKDLLHRRSIHFVLGPLSFTMSPWTLKWPLEALSGQSVTQGVVTPRPDVEMDTFVATGDLSQRFFESIG